MSDAAERRLLDPEAHILIVEDDGEMRNLVARLLREAAFRVSAIWSSAATRNKAETAIVSHAARNISPSWATTSSVIAPVIMPRKNDTRRPLAACSDCFQYCKP